MPCEVIRGQCVCLFYEDDGNGKDDVSIAPLVTIYANSNFIHNLF